MKLQRLITCLLAALLLTGLLPAGAETGGETMEYIYYSEAFTHPDRVGEDIRTYLPDWELRWDKAGVIASSVQSEATEGEEPNYYLLNKLWQDRPIYTFSTAEPRGLVAVSARVNMASSVLEDEMYDFTFLLSDAESLKTRFVFEDDELSEIRFTSADHSSFCFITEAELSSLTLLDTWVTLKWVLDLEEQTVNLCVNDVQLNYDRADCSLENTARQLQQIQFDIGSNHSGLSLGLDDFTVSAMLPEALYQATVLQTSLQSEHLSKESVYAITKDLDLSLNSLASALSEQGLSVAFSSSNSSCISIENGVGRVTRGAEDEAVTVSATISDASGVLYTKDFDFIVKAADDIVYSSQSFYYPEAVNGYITETDSGWHTRTPVTNGLSAVVDYADNNHALKISRTEAIDSDTNSCRYRFEMPVLRELTLAGRIKFDKPAEEDQLYACRIYGNYQTESGVTENVILTEFIVDYLSNGSSVRVLYADPDNTGTKTLLNKAPGLNRWHEMKLSASAARQTWELWLNGEKLNTEPIPFYERDKEGVDRVFCSGITRVDFFPYRHYAGGTMYLDDVAISSHSGIYGDVLVYNEVGREIDGLELTEGGNVSARVHLYQIGQESIVTEPMVIAAVYQAGELLSAQPRTVSYTETAGAEFVFSEIALPQQQENVSLRFYCWESGTLRPLGEAYTFANHLTGELEPLLMMDEDTGRSYYALDFHGEDALRSYYTMPIWTKDAKRFYFYTDQYKIFEYNTETHKYQYIDTAYDENLVMVSKMGNLFYINDKREVKKMNPDTREKVTIGTLPECFTSRVILLQVNHAETRLSIEGYSNDLDRDEQERIPLMDIATGEWMLDYSYGFDIPTYAPDHMSLNPVYDNLVLFAHEGTGIDNNGNQDRIWMLDTETKTYTNVLKQKQYTNTIPGETVSHEAWSHTGERIVMAMASNRLGPGGVLSIKKDGTDRRYVNSDYTYLHLSDSPASERFVVSDTNYDGNTTKLVLIDTYTGKSHLLATLRQTGKDPGHTHPNFSWDGNIVTFGLYSEDGKTIRVGWMDVSDLVNTPIEGGTYELSDSCDTRSYKGTDFYVEPSGESGYRIPAGNHLNVNVKAEVLEKEQADVQITLSYLDSGTDDIVLSYEEWQVTEQCNLLETKEYRLARTGSGEVKTAVIELTDVNLENMKLMGTDFTIYGSETAVEVYSVAVQEKPTDGEEGVLQ